MNAFAYLNLTFSANLIIEKHHFFLKIESLSLCNVIVHLSPGAYSVCLAPEFSRSKTM